MKIYTKTGDEGTTALIGGQRVGKDDPRVEAYGTADELAATIACLRDGITVEMNGSGCSGTGDTPDDAAIPALGELRDDLRRILNTLMSVQASLASPPDQNGAYRIRDGDVAFLESRIDAIYETLPPIAHFTIPGGHPLVSQSHVCRTVCRRAERCAVRASRDYGVDPDALKYLNRLSDYLYGAGRKLSLILGCAEEYWES